MRDDRGGTLQCSACISRFQSLVRPVVRVQIVSREHEWDVARGQREIEREAELAQPIEAIAHSRVIRFRPVEMKNVWLLIFQKARKREDTAIAIEEIYFNAAPNEGIGEKLL